MFSTVVINQALLPNLFVKISIYLLLPLKWSVHAPCIPPPSHFLNSRYFLWTPNNSNSFRFPLKGPAIKNRLYLQIIKYIKLKMVGVFYNIVIIIVNDII